VHADGAEAEEEEEQTRERDERCHGFTLASPVRGGLNELAATRAGYNGRDVMRDRLFALAVLVAGCAAPAASAPGGASTPVPEAPDREEPARLEGEFRDADRQAADLLAESPPPSCPDVHASLDNLGGIAARICALSSRRDGPHFVPGVPCSYTMERMKTLGQQARKLGCQRRERYREHPDGDSLLSKAS
jgi:hypothetical protein